MENGYQEPLTELFDKEKTDIINAILSTLTNKEQRILRERYLKKQNLHSYSKTIQTLY